MDFSKLDTASPASAGEVLQIKHPATGETLEGTTIMLRGSDSPEFQVAAQQIMNKRLAAMNRKGTVYEVSAEVLLRDGIENLVAVTIGWEAIELDGKTLEFSTANARRLYSDKRFPWLREQVDEFVSDRRNFLKALPAK